LSGSHLVQVRLIKGPGKAGEKKDQRNQCHEDRDDYFCHAFSPFFFSLPRDIYP
jgi:hypothetical protein